MDRVALVSEHASPLAALGGVDAGGQNVHVAALARGLARRGVQVDVYTRRDAPTLPPSVEVEPGLVVHHLAAGPPAPVPKDELLPHMGAFARRLAGEWAGDVPDLVHSHFWMSGLAAVEAAAPFGVPVVQTFHALGTVKRRHQGAADTSPPQRCALERRLVTEVDAVIATCRDEVVELRAMGADERRIEVVPCGVDTEVFRPTGPAAPRDPSVRHRVVVVTRLVPRKGVEDVVRALAQVPDTEVVVVGGPAAPDVDADPEVARLRGVARAAGVDGRLRFLGSRSRSEVAAWLRSADLAACAPWYEPFGIVPLEAMACGVPVVGTAVGGLLDSVLDGRTGLLVPPHDPTALAAALGGLLASPDRRTAMGRAAASRARRRYTWSAVVDATLAAYRRCLAGRAVPGGVVA